MNAGKKQSIERARNIQSRKQVCGILRLDKEDGAALS